MDDDIVCVLLWKEWEKWRPKSPAEDQLFKVKKEKKKGQFDGGDHEYSILNFNIL